jgi:hypothetical protein
MVAGDMETWKHGDIDMETWKHRGNETGIPEDMENEDIKRKTEAQALFLDSSTVS